MVSVTHGFEHLADQHDQRRVQPLALTDGVFQRHLSFETREGHGSFLAVDVLDLVSDPRQV